MGIRTSLKYIDGPVTPPKTPGMFVVPYLKEWLGSNYRKAKALADIVELAKVEEGYVL